MTEYYYEFLAQSPSGTDLGNAILFLAIHIHSLSPTK